MHMLGNCSGNSSITVKDLDSHWVLFSTQIAGPFCCNREWVISHALNQ